MCLGDEKTRSHRPICKAFDQPEAKEKPEARFRCPGGIHHTRSAEVTRGHPRSAEVGAPGSDGRWRAIVDEILRTDSLPVGSRRVISEPAWHSIPETDRQWHPIMLSRKK